MKIGIIGAGNIGGTLGRLWVQAGHFVRFGVRDSERVKPLLVELGSSASVGSARDAAEFGEVVVFAGPYGAWPRVVEDAKDVLVGKIVVDAANPYGARDGAIVEAVSKSGKGSALFTASLLPGARVIKAFNTIYWVDLRDKAHQPGALLAMPIAGDDASAVSQIAILATDAGFEPVIVGGLDQSIALDPGSPIYAKSFTASKVREVLNLPPSPGGQA
ncbi:MAG: NAD(P)-binding domain-containing protein [Alphaproteobacteria bacterium]